MISPFLRQLEDHPDSVQFNDCIAYIDAHYQFSPCAFRNGAINNQEGENSGSCKIFAFGLLHALSKDQTLACFGRFYREDVLQNPGGDSHQNIRQFMQTGWDGIYFERNPLVNQ